MSCSVIHRRTICGGLEPVVKVQALGLLLSLIEVAGRAERLETMASLREASDPPTDEHAVADKWSRSDAGERNIPDERSP